MKFNLKDWKKTAQSNSHSTFKHANGSELKIAHNSLSPKTRAQLASLEIHKPSLPKPNFDSGGAIAAPSPPPTEPVQTDIYKKRMQGSGWIPPVNKASGGDINQFGKDDESDPGEQGMPAQLMPPSKLSPLQQVGMSMQKAGSKRYAEGTPDAPISADDPGEQGDQPAMQQISEEPGAKPEPTPPAAPSAVGPQNDPNADQPAPSLAQQPAGPMTNPADEPPSQLTINPSVPASEEQRAAQIQRDAASQLASQAADAYQKKMNFDAQVNQHAMNSQSGILDQFGKVSKEIQTGKIDPEDYWKNHSKVMSVLGLLIAGFNPTSRPNAAGEYLDQAIKNNIAAQEANMNKKHNLLGALTSQYHDIGLARDAAVLHSANMLDTSLRMMAAKQGSQQAQQQYLNAAAAIQNKYGPQLWPFSQRVALSQMQEGAQNGQYSNTDPTMFVPTMVPEPHQKDVYHEIKTAQDAAKNEDFLMKQFDQAAQDTRPMAGGAWKNALPGITPASIQSMNAMELPMIHDAEGRVNEFEQKTMNDLHPQFGDNDAKIAAKRQAYQQFIEQKKSAPTAKSFGIDLSKFKSAGPQEARLAPVQNKTGQTFSPDQQRQYLDWARKNPNDPRAQAIFKRLGIK